MITKLNLYLQNQYPRIIQWLVNVLLGMVNIEQSKLADHDSFHILLGSSMKTLHLQRYFLYQFSGDTELLNKLYLFNSELVNAEQSDIYYYDPHTKKYTGENKILKGWCGALGRPDKILNMDFIHTVNGEPVFIKHLDNFYDLRERFDSVIEEFRTVMKYGENKELCFVIDRGIYSFDLFDAISEKTNINLITWEKGYKGGQWDEGRMTGEFIMSRKRNHEKDKRLYFFKYIDQEWERKPKMRQIIVKATNPKGNTIELSIVTTDQMRNTRDIIKYMFSRWIQENDFKYLIKHFGINEITSYATVPYSRLLNLNEDKKTKTGQYKALEQQYQSIKKKLESVLFKQHEKKEKMDDNSIITLTKELNEVKETLSKTSKESSKLDLLISEEYKKLDTRCKVLMDIIKIIARNIFYKTFQPFKEQYQNYRDDHVVFRNLTRSHGVILYDKDIVNILLFPTASYPPKIREIVENFLLKVNEGSNINISAFPDRIVQLKLGKKSEKLFAISNASNNPIC